MADEIAVLELELELKRENLELRQKLAAMIDYTLMQENLAASKLETETYNLKQEHRDFRSRVESMIFRGAETWWTYTLSRRRTKTGEKDEEFTFEYNPMEMMIWLDKGNPNGSWEAKDIPDELEGFRESFKIVRDAKKADLVEDEEVEEEQREPVCMDEAGVPTTFTRKCGICGEEGRNARTHKEEPITVDGRMTHHWI